MQNVFGPIRAYSLLSIGFSVVCLLIAGCGQSLTPVNGKVELDGKAFQKGRVVLWPMEAKGNKFTGMPQGEVDDEGKFRIMTDGRSGAPPGWYKATVTSSEIPDSSKPMATKSKIAERFRDAAKTTLEIEVVSAPAPGAYDLKISQK